MGMGKSPPPLSPLEVSAREDNLTMIADMFEAMRVTGKDPDMPIKEIADIGLQLIDMIRQANERIADLRQMHESVLAQASAQHVSWGDDQLESGRWYSGGYRGKT